MLRLKSNGEFSMKKTILNMMLALLFFSVIDIEPAHSQQVQIVTNPSPFLNIYRARAKTVLEEVLNYTSSGLTEGSPNGISSDSYLFIHFWVSGLNGAHACVLTQVIGEVPENNKPGRLVLGKVIDIREFNQTSFRINISGRRGHLQSSVGDERTRVTIADVSPNIQMERLQNAWGLAFQQCPGRRSAF
jgi:hypothetical protein